MEKIRFSLPSLTNFLKNVPILSEHNEKELTCIYNFVWSVQQDYRVEDVRDACFEIELDFSCKCGKSYHPLLRVPAISSFCMIDVLMRVEENLCCCRCDAKIDMNYACDVVCPYYCAPVHEAVQFIQSHGQYHQYATEGVDPIQAAASDFPIKVPPKYVQMLKDIQCLDMERICVALEAQLVGLFTDRKVHEIYSYAASVKEHGIPYSSVGIHLDRYLFEKGMIGATDKLPLSPTQFHLLLGTKIERSLQRNIETIVRTMLLVCDDGDTLGYLKEIFIHPKHRNKVMKCIYEYQAAGFSLPEEVDRVKFVSGAIPHTLSKEFTLGIQAWIDDEDDAVVPGFEDLHLESGGPGLRSGSYCDLVGRKGMQWLTQQSGYFPSAKRSLATFRKYRKKAAILDGVLKPCSSYETWFYGNAYSTIAKWWRVASALPKGSILAAGCGKKNWWMHALQNRNVTYIDNADFKRSEVIVVDAIDHLLKNEYDVVLSDIQCPLDWGKVARSIKKTLVIKVLPRFDADLPEMVANILNSGFNMARIYTCGRLHNGEVLVRFDRRKQISHRHVRFTEKWAPGRDVDPRNRYGKIIENEAKIRPDKQEYVEQEVVVDSLESAAIKGAMAYSMAIGERIRRAHLRSIMINELHAIESELPGMTTERQIVRRLASIRRSEGSIYRWEIDTAN